MGISAGGVLSGLCKDAQICRRCGQESEASAGSAGKRDGRGVYRAAAGDL